MSFIDMCCKPVSWATCSLWIVLPTPGVPVIMMLGAVRMIARKMCVNVECIDALPVCCSGSDRVIEVMGCEG